MSRVSAPTREAVSSKEMLQESTQSSTTVIEHVLSRLKDIGISKVFGVAGDFAFPIEDAIGREPGIEWVGCSNELNAAYAADSGTVAVSVVVSVVRPSRSRCAYSVEAEKYSADPYMQHAADRACSASSKSRVIARRAASSAAATSPVLNAWTSRKATS